MSMLRQDPLTGRWVIIAVGRSARPNDFPAAAQVKTAPADCPFCPGNESQTTPEILALGRPDDLPANGPGWRLRAFRNMFPALVPEAKGDVDNGDDFFFRQGVGAGHHEVVVYEADHEANPATLTVDQMAELLGVLQDRSRVMAQHPSVKYVSAFCNRGSEAGATLVHPHMQIIGAPQVPIFAEAKARRAAKYFAGKGNCLVCDLAVAELASGERIVARNDDWVCFTPWASRFPWEILFVPLRHTSSLMAATDDELVSLAKVLSPTLKKLFERHGDLSLNIVIHNASLDAEGEARDPQASHWHLEVLPRLSRPAGFEVGTGYAINAVVPEEAAQWLRENG